MPIYARSSAFMMPSLLALLMMLSWSIPQCNADSASVAMKKMPYPNIPLAFSPKRILSPLQRWNANDNNDSNKNNSNSAVADAVQERTSREWVAETSYVLPFGADAAYRAFADMERQPSWSDHLKRAETIKPPTSPIDIGVVNFISNVFGIQYGAQCIGKRIYPRLVEWRSIAGVQFTARITFRQEGFGPNARTTMNFVVRFVPPRLFAAVFGRSNGAMLRFVENRMMINTMKKFSAVVQTKDLGRQTVL